MWLFNALVVLHVLAGTIGLISIWVPIIARKGSAAHRKWGALACYALIAAGALAIAMALFSLFAPYERHPVITDRDLFSGLFGWMMLYLGMLTIGFGQYGLMSAKVRNNRLILRSWRHQLAQLFVVISAIKCGSFGLSINQPLMVAVSIVGLIAIGTQQLYIWRPSVARGKYVGEHLRAMLGMGISAYTAFLSVGLIRLVPDHVFNPLIWAIPSVIGVGMIVGYTVMVNRALLPAPVDQS